MNIEYNSLERADGASPYLKDGFEQCTCGECDQVFVSKKAIIEALKPFMKKYKDLPIDINFTSFKVFKNEQGFMTIKVDITQTGIIHKKEFDKL